jgi:hypothetical protein
MKCPHPRVHLCFLHMTQPKIFKKNFFYLQVQILVTGSLHLIGGILNLIDPDLWKHKKSDQEILEENNLVQSYNEMEKDVHNSPAKFYKSS